MKPKCVCGGELRAEKSVKFTDDGLIYGFTNIISCNDCPTFSLELWDYEDFIDKWLELGGKMEEII